MRLSSTISALWSSFWYKNILNECTWPPPRTLLLWNNIYFNNTLTENYTNLYFKARFFYINRKNINSLFCKHPPPKFARRYFRAYFPEVSIKSGKFEPTWYMYIYNQFAQKTAKSSIFNTNFVKLTVALYKAYLFSVDANWAGIHNSSI